MGEKEVEFSRAVYSSGSFFPMLCSLFLARMCIIHLKFPRFPSYFHYYFIFGTENKSASRIRIFLCCNQSESFPEILFLLLYELQVALRASVRKLKEGNWTENIGILTLYFLLFLLFIMEVFKLHTE